jgi:hypothetical protein
MKQRKMEQLSYENDLTEFDLMIEFIKRITEKKEITYQNYEFDIEEDDFIDWINKFRTGNPVKFMNQTEKKKFISVVIRMLDD